jgi:flagellar basal-body rod modification protein FlgD
MASAVNSLFGASTPGTTTNSSSSSSSSPAPSEEVFLQLLVSQIKNQDPLNPSDSTQFVTQLAQFSELEQVIGIRSDIESANKAASPTGSTPPVTTPGTTTPSTGNTTPGTSTTSTN